MTKCFYCEQIATVYNKQKIPVCTRHKNQELKIEKCPICKRYAELKEGKYGIFILCEECGCISMKKYKEMIT